jgi:epoxyqueuosine reductase QueG
MSKPINTEHLRRVLEDYVQEYPQRTNERDNFWRPPLLVTAEADQRFAVLPKIAAKNHLLPSDLLSSARTVIVFFIPFKVKLVEENHPGKFPCPNWGVAYEVTNQLINAAGERIANVLRTCGNDAVPTPVTEEGFFARWSHKHIGYLCDLGRFGINAQLITPAGCAGRMGSLITNADLGDHPLVTKSELCLYKNGWECLQCVPRCPVKAVSIEGIDYQRCSNRLKFNRKNRISLGLGERTHGCAKCQVNLPCSLKDPTAEYAKDQAYMKQHTVI